MDAAAGFMLSGGESGKGSGLSGVVEVGRMNAKGQQLRDGLFADAMDRVEQVTLVLHLLVAVNVLANGVDQIFDLFIEPIDVLGNSAANRLAGDIEAIAFLNPQARRASRRGANAFGVCSLAEGACQGSDWRSAQKLAISRASPASVLPRARQDWAKDLI
jgi:hypothetical protein